MNEENPEQVIRRVQSVIRSAGERPVLVGFDANGIQELVAAASRPVAMRGASRMIKAFDEWSGRCPESIFGGGGRGLWVVGGNARAEDARSQQVQEFAKRTNGGVLACATAAFDPTAERASLMLLRLRLGNEKDAAPAPRIPLAKSRSEQCAYCQVRAATCRIRRSHESLEEDSVCSRCDQAVRYGQQEASQRDESGQTCEDISTDGSIGVVSLTATIREPSSPRWSHWCKSRLLVG